MEKVVVLFVAGLFGAMLPPSVRRIAIEGGPHVSHFDGDRSLYMTAGVSATTSRGLELGVYHTSRGYDSATCMIDPRQVPGMGMDREGMALPPCFGDIRRFHRNVRYFDMKLLWRRDVVRIRRSVLHLSAGGIVGSARNCVEESRDEWSAGECQVHDRDYMRGLVAGAGLDVRMAERFHFTLGAEYGHELGVTATQVPGPPFSIQYRTKSLTAGFVYRR